MNRKFIEEIYDRETKLRKAMIFEANLRLMKHPYDLVGRRRLKLFEESLKNYLKVGDHTPQKMTKSDNLKQKIANFLNPNEHTVEVLKVSKVVSVVTLITLLVNVNDYIQDIKVIDIFWHIGYEGYLLEQKNSTDYMYTEILLLKFYPPAMFLSVVMIFSFIQVMFHIPSLWFRYRVSMQMENPNTESGMEDISPQDVYNQYNLSISESKNEAI